MEGITKRTLELIPRVVTEAGCWEKTSHVNRPTLKIWDETFPLSRLSAHLWHKLDLNNVKDFVCHRCNNPKCFNPDHIYIGSNQDNMLDAVQAKTHVQARKELHTCGRPYDYSVRRSDGSKERYCHHCKLEATRRWRRRQKK